MPETADIDLSSDQAAGLRRLFGARGAQVVTFASGRESSGRTTLVVQTAAALAAAGHAVVIVDENPGPNNAISAFGLAARHDLMQAIEGERSLRGVTLHAAPLVRVISAARAAREIHPADGEACDRVSACLAELQRGAAFVLIDCATRRGGHLSPLALAARHLAVVVAAQGSAITHAYALIKQVAAARSGRAGFQIVITRARRPEEAQAIFSNMQRVAWEHLGVRLDLLGAASTPATAHLADAMIARLPPALDTGYADGFPQRNLSAILDNGLVL
ncbi:MAG: MinD/ParA family ATP-binding protein [Ignavibacteria bacterium]